MGQCFYVVCGQLYFVQFGLWLYDYFGDGYFVWLFFGCVELELYFLVLQFCEYIIQVVVVGKFFDGVCQLWCGQWLQCWQVFELYVFDFGEVFGLQVCYYRVFGMLR